MVRGSQIRFQSTKSTFSIHSPSGTIHRPSRTSPETFSPGRFSRPPCARAPARPPLAMRARTPTSGHCLHVRASPRRLRRPSSWTRACFLSAIPASAPKRRLCYFAATRAAGLRPCPCFSFAEPAPAPLPCAYSGLGGCVLAGIDASSSGSGSSKCAPTCTRACAPRALRSWPACRITSGRHSPGAPPSTRIGPERCLHLPPRAQTAMPPHYRAPPSARHPRAPPPNSCPCSARFTPASGELRPLATESG
jgi:hypothetical protein